MCPGDEVAIHKMHGLNSSSSKEFTTIIDHKKYQGKDPIVRDPNIWFNINCAFNISHVTIASKFAMLTRATMLSKVVGALDVKIELAIDPKSSYNPNAKSSTTSSSKSCITFASLLNALVSIVYGLNLWKNI